MTEIELIEKAAIKVGMKSLMNHGAGSCVYTEGCNGVSQAHLVAFAREVALRSFLAFARGPNAPTKDESNALRTDHPLAQGDCLHGIRMNANCTACAGQINPGSAPREDGHE